MEITLYKGLDAAIKYLNVIKKDSVEQYNLTSDEYNSFGYDLLRIQHSSDAIRWFQLFENIFSFKYFRFNRYRRFILQ